MPSRRVRVYLRVVTPLFMGGADQATAEWRVPTIKGLLRWWYRASHPLQPGESIDQLRKREARIFGGVSTSQGQNDGEGQGLFLLRSSHCLQPIQQARVGKLFGAPGSPLGYLGYGLVVETRNQHTIRGALQAQGHGNGQENSPDAPADTDAELTFIFRPGCTDSDVEAVLDSLWLLCHLGGMGSRSRRGMGSVNWVRYEELPPLGQSQKELPPAAQVTEEGRADQPGAQQSWCWPPQATDVDTLLSNIETVIRRLLPATLWASAEAPYTCFCQGTTILVGRPYPSWEQALEAVGTCLQQHRSVLAEHPNYTDDYDLMTSFLNGQPIDHPPRRATFGLPHNYFFRHNKMKAYVNAAGRLAGGEVNRRASPLLIHIEQLASSLPAFIPVVTFFPAAFLPPGGRIEVHGGGNSKVFNTDSQRISQPQQQPQGVGYDPIRAFLDAFKNTEGAQEVTL